MPSEFKILPNIKSTLKNLLETFENSSKQQNFVELCHTGRIVRCQHRDVTLSGDFKTFSLYV